MITCIIVFNFPVLLYTYLLGKYTEFSCDNHEEQNGTNFEKVMYFLDFIVSIWAHFSYHGLVK